jgi:hypothetical protein
MSKVLLSTVVAALVCVAGSARADQGISSSTLDKMGLSGMTVVSDHDAMSIRGLGYSGGNHGGGSSSGCKTCGPRGSVSPNAKAYGNSSASISIEDPAAAHSSNGYKAEGPYEADGTNYSEAGAVITNIETVDFGDGTVKTVTTTCSKLVFAGGSSTSKAF